MSSLKSPPTSEWGARALRHEAHDGRHENSPHQPLGLASESWVEEPPQLATIETDNKLQIMAGHVPLTISGAKGLSCHRTSLDDSQRSNCPKSVSDTKACMKLSLWGRGWKRGGFLTSHESHNPAVSEHRGKRARQIPRQQYSANPTTEIFKLFRPPRDHDGRMMRELAEA
jgi:hypothetical protein